MKSVRRKSRVVNLGGVLVGGDNPIVVQSMTNTDTRDVDATVNQIKTLEAAGCEVVRVAVMDEEAARAIRAIRPRIAIPLVADIHFDYRLALLSLDAGADGLRLNPGNIGSRRKVEEVVRAAKERNVPIRIGVNAGSLEKRLLDQYGEPCAEAMVESAMHHIAILEDLDFKNIKVSLKASSLKLTLEAYRRIAGMVDYPLHLGITEAGTKDRGLIKSALGLGLLLSEGIGDTVRVSLTADPVDEVWAAYEILRALGLRKEGAELVSCPTCGRTEVDIIKIAEEVDSRLRSIREPIKVAVMGCVVNGPGEVRDADVGIAGGRGFGFLFKKGKIVRKVEEDKLVKALMDEIDNILQGGYSQ
ncbi:MAG TPA: flavodoxin-dependent (E)-4-hydroxy-3-methylbut-2-enyl-diphosphate synthase [Syntrophothermus lipocalidus]|uniref:flavodoxin-dependent (E)-4-hydroxy-3-methylbut-2-enyl-diphosphate synthase n=1 Tax=Syntrophothermus lipocalidus TaxID=86170 RepID=UPI00059DAB5D|nr:flavodoxin-dependent (E)-4-hydroxy-3-methylbut-2-enyl-diphosphate synthase [Syntrophothermus lipocalidus]HHV77172.1 flavodoxin-dependent (E)-4-hydroxy-3-methylbut-2-enyl-diphosphate synthase [Syntrophothermus lipocalidus]